MLFSRSVWLNPSTRADLGFFLLNVWVAGLLLAGALFSASWIAGAVGDGLRGALGRSPLEGVPVAASVLVGTVAAYLAYELGYWIDHYLSHKVPALWAFHKVHHAAEVMTPLTVFRVHPVESLKFHNILALSVGVTGGLTGYLFGPGAHEMLLFGQNAILIVFVFSVVHLQHSHAWMTFSGGLGQLVMSPAHHQIHHSADPRHFGKNLGSCLTLWDRAFGTHYAPGECPPVGLSFGAEGHAPHTVTGGLITPFIESWEAIRSALPSGKGRGAEPVGDAG